MQCIMPQNLTTPDKLLGNPMCKSFLEPSQYRCVIDRCNDGYELLNLNIEIDDDLLKIFKKFSKSIRDWSDRSKKKVSNSKEGRTTKAAWRDSIATMEKYADRNDAIADAIEQKVLKNLKVFQTNNYGKNLIHVKKSKDLEKQFKRAQTPWTETLDKITDAKHAYHEAKRKLNQAKEVEEVATTDVGSTDEQKRKASNNVERRRKEVETCIQKHDSLIDDIEPKKDRYIKEMKSVLGKANDFERERLEQFRTSFTALQETLLIETDKYQKSIQEAFTNAINLQDINKDIEEFGRLCGTEINCKWPSFEKVKI